MSNTPKYLLEIPAALEVVCSKRGQSSSAILLNDVSNLGLLADQRLRESKTPTEIKR